jgi:hypothetical protein
LEKKQAEDAKKTLKKQEKDKKAIDRKSYRISTIIGADKMQRSSSIGEVDMKYEAANAFVEAASKVKSNNYIFKIPRELRIP